MRRKGMARLGAVLAALALAGVGLASALWISKDAGTPTAPVSQEGTASSRPASQTTAESGIRRYLLAGIDANNLTDTLIVGCLDYEAGTVSLLSIPRDTYVGDTYVRTGKINAVYARTETPTGQTHRMENLVWCIGEYLGIPLDGYFALTMEGLVKLIDAVGGLQVDLPRSIYDTKAGIRLFDAGVQTLTGSQCEAFLRHRNGYRSGDLGRVEAAKVFCAALYRRVQQLDLADLAAVMASGAFGEADTDLSGAELLKTAVFLKGTQPAQITAVTLPGVQFDSEAGYACYAVNKTRLTEILDAFFDLSVEPGTLRVPEPTGVDYTDTYENTLVFSQLTE